MKTPYRLAAALLISMILGHSRYLFAQGSLTTPGAPGPTMVTLQQIESRTPISYLPINITNSGSYFLVSNLISPPSSYGIIISTNDVTIDLKGFELRGGVGSDAGIYAPGNSSNITVINGTIRNWGIYGIYVYGCTACVFQGLRILNNGNDGIFGNVAVTVKDCVVQGNNIYGISIGNNGVVTGCTAYGNTNGIGVGYGSVITSCSSVANVNYGIFAGTGTTVHSCSVQANGGPGIITQDACTISGCTINQNGGDGIYLANGASGGGSTVTGCTVTANLNNGIHVLSGGNRIVDNVCSFNGTNNSTNFAGIRVDGNANRIEGNNLVQNYNRGLKVNFSSNFIVRNTASFNTVNYDTTGTQTIGPDVTATGTITSTSPWANFEY